MLIDIGWGRYWWPVEFTEEVDGEGEVEGCWLIWGNFFSEGSSSRERRPYVSKTQFPEFNPKVNQLFQSWISVNNSTALLSDKFSLATDTRLQLSTRQDPVISCSFDSKRVYHLLASHLMIKATWNSSIWRRGCFNTKYVPDKFRTICSKMFRSSAF